jgi:hypothetical protein
MRVQRPRPGRHALPGGGAGRHTPGGRLVLHHRWPPLPLLLLLLLLLLLRACCCVCRDRPLLRLRLRSPPCRCGCQSLLRCWRAAACGPRAARLASRAQAGGGHLLRLRLRACRAVLAAPSWLERLPRGRLPCAFPGVWRCCRVVLPRWRGGGARRRGLGMWAPHRPALHRPPAVCACWQRPGCHRRHVAPSLGRLAACGSCPGGVGSPRQSREPRLSLATHTREQV